MRRTLTGAIASLVVVAVVVVAPAAVAAPVTADRAAAVMDHWTPARLADAEPRDLLIDGHGLGFERRDDGQLRPHGHGRAASIPVPTVVPSAQRGAPQPAPLAGAPRDTIGPTISGMNPASGATIGTAHAFSAVVTDDSGLRSVTFTLTAPNGRNTSYAATPSGTTWKVAFQGFTTGKWSWTVKATDNRGNVRTSAKSGFTVSTTPADPALVTNSQWSGGAVQKAAGRIYFEMPDSRATSGWSGYVCSGTVVEDANGDQSVILTAAHCVYDDVKKVFARNVLFIPDQAGTTGSGTDANCLNDTYGCWAPSFGVVDLDWTTSTFPSNIPWDYAYYVVPAAGAHTGATASSESLEQAVGTLEVQFDAPPRVDVADSTADRTHALGYSFSNDPTFMYCAEDMTTEGTANWWLSRCGLSGGASGGPWIQPFDAATGSGPVISVNSWGYTNQPGMAGPKLNGTSASALFDAINGGLATTQERGVVLDR